MDLQGLVEPGSRIDAPIEDGGDNAEGAGHGSVAGGADGVHGEARVMRPDQLIEAFGRRRVA